MKRRFDPSAFQYVNVTAEKTSHVIPVDGDGKVELEIRSSEDVWLNFVTVDGETVPQEKGSIVRWNGLVQGCSGVEIVANTSFWYQCRKSTKWWEIPDPTPMVIELVQTQDDIIRQLIDERLRVWKVQQNIQRDLTEEEKDELTLDIVNGDLEFDDSPDQFGLGYEERLAEFNARHAEQSDPEGMPAPQAETPAPAPAGGSNSSST